MRVRIPVLVASLVMAAGHAYAQAAPDTGHKSPVLAGVASYFLPGVGSWYAGNDHHASVHGRIALGLGAAALVTSAVGDCFELACKEEASNAILGVVIVAYTINEIWATVTAVRDAQAYNERTERLRTATRLDVTPSVWIAASPVDATRWRVELRVLRLGF